MKTLTDIYNNRQPICAEIASPRQKTARLAMTSLLLFLFVTAALVHWCAISFADIPHLINYQGKLTDKDNKPITKVKDEVMSLRHREESTEKITFKNSCSA